MSDSVAARLAHDVGKYVARIAHNVPPDGPIPSGLVPLLAKDLYEHPGGGRPSARFAELAPDDPALRPVREALAAIDALEADVRAADDAACRRACALALEVEGALRAYAAEAR